MYDMQRRELKLRTQAYEYFSIRLFPSLFQQCSHTVQLAASLSERLNVKGVEKVTEVGSMLVSCLTSAAHLQLSTAMRKTFHSLDSTMCLL